MYQIISFLGTFSLFFQGAFVDAEFARDTNLDFL